MGLAITELEAEAEADADDDDDSSSARTTAGESAAAASTEKRMVFWVQSGWTASQCLGGGDIRHERR